MKKIKLILTFVCATFFVFGGNVAFAEVPQPVAEQRTLTEDETWTGDFMVTKDLNLNGHVLTVDGNLILAEKSIDINGGKLIVKGDFRIQKLDRNSKGLDYDVLTNESYGATTAIIKMNKAEDYLLVEGNFYPDGSHTILRAGTTELKGNIISATNSYLECFAAQGTHTTLFTGEKDQVVYFSRECYFNNLKVEKVSGQMQFQSSLDAKHIESCNIPVGGNGYVILNMYHNKELNLSGSGVTIDGHVFLSRGNLTLNNGQLTVTKNFHIEDVKDVNKKRELSYDQLVASDFVSNATVASLIMTKEKDSLTVLGHMIVNAKANQTELRAGRIDLKGDFTLKNRVSGNVTASGTHQLIMSGEKKQTITMNYPSYYDNKNVLRAKSHLNIITFTNKETYINEKTLMTGVTASYKRHYANTIQYFTPVVSHAKKGGILNFEKNAPFAYNGVFYMEANAAAKLLDAKLVYDKKKNSYSFTIGNKNVILKSAVFGKTACINLETCMNGLSINYAYEPSIKTLSIE